METPLPEWAGGWFWVKIQALIKVYDKNQDLANDFCAGLKEQQGENAQRPAAKRQIYPVDAYNDKNYFSGKNKR
jgi:hypothetical protein